jgi:hypothetical protein
MKQRILALLAALALAATMAAPAPARVTRELLAITSLTSGSLSTFTTDTTIYTRRYVVQADKDNAAIVYIGTSTMDPTSAATLSNTCLVELDGGDGWSPPISHLLDGQGEQYRLSDLRASGATGEKVRIAYEVQNQ